MSIKIIEKLKENKYNTVKKSDFKCSICNCNLYIVNNKIIKFMDGNIIYHCEHSNILHLNKISSETNFNSEKNYKLIDGCWNVC
jgi:Zn-finger protein